MLLASYTTQGLHRWSVAYAGESFDQPQDLEIGSNGLYVAGRFKDDLRLGNQVLLSQSQCVAETSQCEPECGDGFRCVNTQCIVETALCEPACGPQFDCVQNNYDLFVGKFSLADGSPLWSKSFGGLGEDHATSVGAGAYEGIFVGGHITGEVSFEEMTYPAVGTGLDGFIYYVND